MKYEVGDEVFRKGQKVSINIVGKNGMMARMHGTLILVRDDEAYIESSLGPLVGEADSLLDEED